MRIGTGHCGLDFGTSNSTLGRVGGNGAPFLSFLEDGRPTIPSALFFDFETDQTLFGRAALAAYVAGADGRMMRSLKSLLGSQLIEESVRIKRRLIPFPDILGLFIGEMKHRAEASAAEILDQVVVGRPVQFVDDDPVADRAAQAQLEAAVRAQGFRHVAFQFEPIAAALDYERQVVREEIGLVVDLGGGTSDFSIVRVSPERAGAADRQSDILATAGVHVGGTDFDRQLSLSSVMPELGYRTETADGKRILPARPFVELATWHRINRLYAPEMLAELRETRREAEKPALLDRLISLVRHREGHKLAGAVEAAKIMLSDAPSAALAFAGQDFQLRQPVTRTELAAALDPLVQRIIDTLHETLRRAGLPPDRIDTLILTGGSTQIPAILARLRATFPSARLVKTDAFGSVGLGLALDAARKFA